MKVTYQAPIPPEMIDQNGHLGVQYYVGLFTNASWNMLSLVRLTPGHMRRNQVSFVARDQHIKYERELHAGDIIRVESSFTRVGTSSLGVLHRMFNIDEKHLCASMETTLVQIDNTSRRSVPIPDFARHGIETGLQNALDNELQD